MSHDTIFQDFQEIIYLNVMITSGSVYYNYQSHEPLFIFNLFNVQYIDYSLVNI